MSDTENAYYCVNCETDGHTMCYDERSFDCWAKDGSFCGQEVYGYFKCGNCGRVWRWPSVADDDPDCECDDPDDY